MERSHGRRTVISMVGKQGSGKTTLGKKLAKYLRCPHIEVSDVVKSVTSDMSRYELLSTGERTKDDPEWLGKAVAAAIEAKLTRVSKNIVVLSGIREIEVVKFLEKHYIYCGFEIISEMPVRYQRLVYLDKITNIDEFLLQEIGEYEMGVHIVEDDAPFQIPTSHETDPEKIIKATVKVLLHKDIRLR